MTYEMKSCHNETCIATAKIVVLILGLDPADEVPLKVTINSHHEDILIKNSQSAKESSFDSNNKTKTN